MKRFLSLYTFLFLFFGCLSPHSSLLALSMGAVDDPSADSVMPGGGPRKLLYSLPPISNALPLSDSPTRRTTALLQDSSILESAEPGIGVLPRDMRNYLYSFLIEYPEALNSLRRTSRQFRDEIGAYEKTYRSKPARLRTLRLFGSSYSAEVLKANVASRQFTALVINYAHPRAQDIAEVARLRPDLRILDLEGAHLDRDLKGFRKMLLRLGRLRGLEVLNLSHSKVGTAFAALGASLKQMSNLKHILLRGCKGLGVVAISKALSGKPLERIDLSHSRLTSGAFKRIARYLGDMPKLEYINVGGNTMVSLVDMRAFGEYLGQQESLRILDVSDMDLDDDKITPFLSSESFAGLDTIYASGNGKITAASLGLLGESLASGKLPSLREVNLRKAHVSVNDLEQFLYAIRERSKPFNVSLSLSRREKAEAEGVVERLAPDGVSVKLLFDRY